ncbi:hypothetical protein CJU90_5303 [Yarrowia sp. C11]|nr:hypothetical protein CJU90_5303 [Yarrowia sp. C11]
MKLLSILALSALAMAHGELYFRTVNDGKSYKNTSVSCLVGELDPRLTVVVETSKVDVEALDRLMDQLEEAVPAVAAAVTFQLINSEVPEYVELFKANGESLQVLARTDDKLRDTLVFWGVHSPYADEVASQVGSRFEPFPPLGINWFQRTLSGPSRIIDTSEIQNVLEGLINLTANFLFRLFRIPTADDLEKLKPRALNQTACRVADHASNDDCIRLTTVLMPTEQYGQLIASYGSCRVRAHLTKSYNGELISKAITDTIDVCMNLQGTAGFMEKTERKSGRYDTLLVCVAGPGGCTYGDNYVPPPI